MANLTDFVNGKITQFWNKMISLSPGMDAMTSNTMRMDSNYDVYRATTVSAQKDILALEKRLLREGYAGILTTHFNNIRGLLNRLYQGSREAVGIGKAIKEELEAAIVTLKEKNGEFENVPSQFQFT
ncbi:hypothetical protein ISS07_01210 [Candidatus Woesearchaeota archaeon]|nr:hypothetical protein [Candidatus Woesearchaeota archaeon]